MTSSTGVGLKWVHNWPLPQEICFKVSFKTGTRTTVYTDMLQVPNTITYSELLDDVKRMIESIDYFVPNSDAVDRLQIRMKTHSRQTQTTYDTLSEDNMALLLTKSWSMRNKYSVKDLAVFEIFVYGTATKCIKRHKVCKTSGNVTVSDNLKFLIEDLRAEQLGDSCTRITIDVPNNNFQDIFDLISDFTTITRDDQSAEPPDLCPY